VWRLGAVAEQGQPAGVHDDRVKRIAMNHPQAMTVRGNGDRVLHDLHAAELQLRKIAQPFVMITRT